MPKHHPSSCRTCGTTKGPISGRGYCLPCAVERQIANSTGMATKTGPVYNSWRERMREVVNEL